MYLPPLCRVGLYFNACNEVSLSTLSTMRELSIEKLGVRIFKNRVDLGVAAAKNLSVTIKTILRTKDVVNIIFASAPSQNEFLAELCKCDVDWGRVVGFHMDEYLGLGNESPQSFGKYLENRLFGLVKLHQVHYLLCNAASPREECKRYADLLITHQPDIVCLGIGENSHLAFNDPVVADFNDLDIVKVVELDLVCRLQQVNDGCFRSLELVPTHALTITIPPLVKCAHAFAVVPGLSKADAIYRTLNCEISEFNPSTILRRHDHCILFIDEDSASKL